MENIIYYVHIDGQQLGPYGLSELKDLNIQYETMVWRSDLPNWVRANSLPEVVEIIDSRFQSQMHQPQEPQYPTQPQFPGQSQYPQYPQQPQCPPQPQYPQQYGQPTYGQPMQGGGHGMLPDGWTNWIGWAIAGTIIGCFACCIGLIFGIIGIVKANEANNMARSGFIDQAYRINRTARTMTILSLVLGGLAILAAVIYWMALGAFYTDFLEMNY